MASLYLAGSYINSSRNKGHLQNQIHRVQLSFTWK